MSKQIINEEDFVVTIGRASEGKSFVQVKHLESSRTASRVGLGNDSTRQVVEHLMRQILEEEKEEEKGSGA